MYMYNLSVCRVSVFRRRSSNVLSRGNDLSAGLADVLRQWQSYVPRLQNHHLSQHICGACGQTIPSAKDIPGPSTENWNCEDIKLHL